MEEKIWSLSHGKNDVAKLAFYIIEDYIGTYLVITEHFFNIIIYQNIMIYC